MRVVHILSGDVWGGAETQVHTLVRTLRSTNEADVSVLLFNDGLTAQRLREHGIPIHILDESKHGFMTLVWGLTRWLKRMQPNVLHSHGYKECVIGTMAAWLAGGIPCIRTVHGWIESHPRLWQVKKRLGRFAERIVLGSQRAVVAVSSELGDRLLRYAKQNNIVVISNGVDVGAIEAAAGSPPAMSNLPWRIGIVGRIVPVKRVDMFVEVCRLLRDEFGDEFQAVIIGDGPRTDDIRAKIRGLHLEDHVEILGFVANVPRVMVTLNALLITSDHEGLPMTLLEAMVLKVPVVAHAVGGIPAALEQGECGWLVHDHNARNYYTTLRQALIDTVETKQRADRAYARAKELFSSSQASQRYCDLYRRVGTAKSV